MERRRKEHRGCCSCNQPYKAVVGEFASGKTSSEHRASLVRGRAEALPQSLSTAAWRFPCFHAPDAAGPWITDLAGITLAFMERKALEMLCRWVRYRLGCGRR